MARSASGWRRIGSAALLALAPLGCVHLELGDVAVATDVEVEACDALRCDVPDDPAFPASMVELTVPSHGAALNGLVYVPPGAGPHPVVVVLHGYPGYEWNGDLAQALRRDGFVVLLFRYRGFWGSPGAFTFEHVREDAAAALAFARSAAFAKSYRADPTRTGLVGHSMGGWASLATAADHPEVRCVASLAGANLGLMGQAAVSDAAVRARLEAAFRAWSGPVRVEPRHDPIAELAARPDRFDARGFAAKLASRPVLLAAGARDDITQPAQHHDPLVAAIAAAGGRVENLVLDADHSFSSQRVALTEALLAWARRACL
jgi:dipeptidyl aminopeptidase/acylaminoacyl peptidase